jgi:hypothetical protein
VHPAAQAHQWLGTDKASQKIGILDRLDKPIAASHTDFQPKIKKKRSERGPKILAFAPISFFQKIGILDRLDKPIAAGHTDFQPKIKKKRSERGPKTLAFAPISFFIPQGLNIHPPGTKMRSTLGQNL